MPTNPSEKYRKKSKAERNADARARYARRYPEGRNSGGKKTVHRLANVNPETQTADCSVCGPGVVAMVSRPSQGGRWRCRAQHLAMLRRGSLARHGLTPEGFDSLLASQDGACAICGKVDPGDAGWQVDHDHDCCEGRKSCGKCTRGILCSPCNFAIGLLGEDPATILAAARYVVSWWKKQGHA